MKKIKTICFIVIGLMFLNQMPANASYSVPIGTTLEYDEIYSCWDIEIDEKVSTGSGFEHEGVNYPNNTLLTVQVTDSDSSSVQYNEIVGSVIDSSTANALNLLSYAILAFYPVLIVSLGTTTWNQTKIDLGLGLLTSYFIDHDESYEFFNQFTNESYIEENFDEPEISYDRAGGHYYQNGSLAIFNWLLDGTMKGSSGLDTFDGNYTYQLAYDVSTSIVQGFELYMNYSGLADGIQTQIYLYQKIELAGFDLPDFYYEVDVKPEPIVEPIPSTQSATSVILGLSPYPIVTSSFIGIGIIVVKRKRRK